MSNWIYLSYPLSSNTPAYANGQALEIEKVKEIEKGDSCNTSFWKFPNHIGTHVDFPSHFDSEGKNIDFYAAEFWIFKNVHIIDISGYENPDKIGKNNIRVDEIPDKTELLMLKTGYGAVRGKEAYWKYSPSFLPELASILRSRCPLLRAIGIDTISISSMQDRELGREAHREFLCSPSPILIIEDMDLSKISRETCVKAVIAAPLRVSGADGAPCTILGELE